MRRFLAFATILALTACGGGGGGSNSAPVMTPTATPSTAPAGKLVTPTFTLRIPAPGSKGSSAKRSPKFVSPSTLSVTITLNSDSAGLPAGASVTTSIPAGSCSAGCTVPGPPSPPGSDNFTITTFDMANGTGNALSTATLTVTISSGVANSSPVTLLGIVASIVINGVPAPSAFAAGATNSSVLTVTASDADGNTITGTYNNPITVSDPDTLSDGSSIAATTCPTQGAETTVAASSVQFTSDASTAVFCYDGIAEADQTLTSSASGVSAGNAGTATFQPLLAAPAFVAGSGTPVGVVNGSEIDLFAPSGTGSTGSVNFTEAGWTAAPFNQLLTATAGTCTSGGPLSTFATLSTAASGGATVITATAASPETPGLCAVTVADGIGAGNPTDATATFNVSYTSTGFGVNGHGRKTH
jgi:hypothetical protein